MKGKITRSRGNIFEDLGFPSEEAEYLKIRSTLMIHLRKTIEAKGMKQAEAAKLLGVTQPRVSDLYKGKIHLFSIDTLVDMLSRAGIHIKLVVGSRGLCNNLYLPAARHALAASSLGYLLSCEAS